MAEQYLLGVDIGTASSKGVLVNVHGRVAASKTVEHGLSNPRPGYFEHDAETVWWADFVAIVRGILQDSGIDPRRIIAVGTSGIGPCVLPINEAGNPLRPGILYGIDSRATEEIATLEEALGREAILAQCGVNLSSQATGPKILWIRNHEPETFEKARWFLTSEAYLVYKLTGVASIDVYTAGSYAPLYDVNELRWIERAAAWITPLERLPQTYWSHEVVGEVTPAAAKETGLAEGTAVIAGTTDAAAEAISSGVADYGDMMLMFGSSIFFIMKTEKLLPTEKFWSSTFLEPGANTFLGGMSTSGSLTKWFRDQFCSDETGMSGEQGYAVLAKLAASSPPGSNGLVALPYFEGERTPIHDPKARGTWFGLSLKHGKEDLYRSLLEGVAYGIRHNLEEMALEGIRPKRILAVGGGTKNALWMQIVADICKVTLNIPTAQIGASYGDAFLAGVGVGAIDGYGAIKEWVELEQTVEPNPENLETYDFYYSIFRDLYRDSKGLMHRLANRERRGG
jgi:xylulokinase